MSTFSSALLGWMELGSFSAGMELGSIFLSTLLGFVEVRHEDMFASIERNTDMSQRGFCRYSGCRC